MSSVIAGLRARVRLRTRIGRLFGAAQPRPARELQPCTGVWGEAELRATRPPIEAHEGAMLLPFSGDPVYDQDRSWGVYTAAGQLIDAAALRRGAGQGLVGQDHASAVDARSLPEAEGDLVYGGVIIAHYGHFICTSLARLWWLAEAARPHEELGGRRVVFHGAREMAGELAFPYIAACFDRLGLNPDNVLVLRRPLRARTLTVPSPAFEEQSFVAPAFRDLCHHIGRPWWRSAPRAASPVYLSKARLAGGVSRIEGEAEIEAILAAKGVEIVYPETLAFAEQVALFSQGRTMLGSIGSAFHTSIFAPPGCRMICLAPGPVINSNMRLLDQVSGAEARYVYPASGGEDRSGVDGFDHSWRLAQPAWVAEELLDLAFS